MADRRDLEFTYSLIDRIFRLSLGELADFSGAKYDGDFSLSLEEAQRRKHEYVAEQIGIEPGRRVLDLGCGWGPLLDFIRRRGAAGVGVTLSSAQAAACRRHGLAITAYCPIARGRAGSDDVLKRIGTAHGKTASQVALRWLVQQNVIVIPRTSKVERLSENFAIFDFVLTPGEMAEIGGLARPKGRLVNVSVAPEWD